MLISQQNKLNEPKDIFRNFKLLFKLCLKWNYLEQDYMKKAEPVKSLESLFDS